MQQNSGGALKRHGWDGTVIEETGRPVTADSIAVVEMVASAHRFRYALMLPSTHSDGSAIVYGANFLPVALGLSCRTPLAVVSPPWL
jgi:hypothetical protein